MPHVAGSTPVPDPTLLTTEALNREISAVRTQLLLEVERITDARHREIVSLKELFDTRLGEMDKAIVLSRERESLLPKTMEKSSLEQRDYLMSIINERSDKVEGQFKERDVRGDRDAAQSKLAIDAALQAQKEAAAEQNKNFEKAIDKSEAAFAKQIDSLGDRLTTATGGLELQIADVKERLTRLEATGLGRTQQVVEHRAASSDMRGAILLCVSLLAITITVASFVIALS